MTRHRREGKASFCEQKEAKKLYLCWAMGAGADNAHGPGEQKFLRRFFQKAAAFLARGPTTA
jgi:hypothetical protein